MTDEHKQNELEIKVGDATFSFGGPTPPIQSWFFPADPDLKPFVIETNSAQEEKEKINDSAQST